VNNKQIGSDFERRMCEVLAKMGYWVHFMSPDNRGAQPFDIIAVKNGIAMAADCKTCDDHIFRLSRLEDNQRLAFEKWRRCGNAEPYLLVKHKQKVYAISYREIENREKIDLDGRRVMCILE